MKRWLPRSTAKQNYWNWRGPAPCDTQKVAALSVKYPALAAEMILPRGKREGPDRREWIRNAYRVRQVERFRSNILQSPPNKRASRRRAPQSKNIPASEIRCLTQFMAHVCRPVTVETSCDTRRSQMLQKKQHG